jgi:hypothetical protein
MHAGTELPPGALIRTHITAATSGSLQGEVLEHIHTITASA